MGDRRKSRNLADLDLDGMRPVGERRVEGKLVCSRKREMEVERGRGSGRG